MSGVDPGADLSALRRHAPAETMAPPRRRWLRFAVPGLLVAGFVAVLLWSFGGVWSQRIAVSVVRPAPAGTATVASGAVAFQAAGWVEPDPFPIGVTALTDGVVAEMLVQESDRVGAGDPVARLVDDDARLAAAAAAQELARARATLAEAEAALAIATEQFAAALAVTEAERIARAELSGRRAEQSLREAAVAGGEAEVRIATTELELQRHLAEQDAAGPRQVELAEARLARARSLLADLRAAALRAGAEVEAAAARATRATRELELRFDDRLQRDTARARRDAAAAAVERAETALAEAELRRDRTIVRAPAAGLVLQRLAQPGRVVPGDPPLPVCTLWDPASVRIRVDVPQAEVAKAFVDQEARILSETRPGRPYSGRVLRILQQADIQKVTLQVHVRVTDGDEWLRPEMLCQVQFLGRSSGAPGGTARAVLRLPARVVRDGAVWIVGADGRAERRIVTLGERSADSVEVLQGVNLSDKVVDELLTPGAELVPGAALEVRQ